MDNLDFLKDSPAGDAAVIVLTPTAEPFIIRGLNLAVISWKAPVLAASFEHNRSGPRCSIEGSTPEAVISLLRFLYLGDYRLLEELIDQPCSQLIHFQLYHFGQTYGISELTDLARLHTIRETELACSTGRAPPELAASIKFLYEKLPKCQDLREIIVHYCINCFCYHNLDIDSGFRQVAHDIIAFHNDLFRANHLRGFNDEGAEKLFQLPVCRPTPHPNEALEKQALGDYLYEILGESSFEEWRKGKSADISPNSVRIPIGLPYRVQSTGTPGPSIWTNESSDESSFPAHAPVGYRSITSKKPAVSQKPQTTRLSCSTCNQRLVWCNMPLAGAEKCTLCQTLGVECDRLQEQLQPCSLPYRPSRSTKRLGSEYDDILPGYVADDKIFASPQDLLIQEKPNRPSPYSLQFRPIATKRTSGSQPIAARDTMMNFADYSHAKHQQQVRPATKSSPAEDHFTHGKMGSFQFPKRSPPSVNVKKVSPCGFDVPDVPERRRHPDLNVQKIADYSAFEFGSHTAQSYVNRPPALFETQQRWTSASQPTVAAVKSESYSTQNKAIPSHVQDTVAIIKTDPFAVRSVGNHLIKFEDDDQTRHTLDEIDPMKSDENDDHDMIVVDSPPARHDNESVTTPDSDWSMVEETDISIAGDGQTSNEWTLLPTLTATPTKTSTAVNSTNAMHVPSEATTKKANFQDFDWTLL